MLNSLYSDEEILSKRNKKAFPTSVAPPPAPVGTPKKKPEVKTGSNTTGLIGGSGDYAGAATQALSLAGSVVARENSEPMGKKDGTMSALSMGASGAALGATVGGPWGAAIGFVAGTGYGLIKAGSDSKKILKKQQQAQSDFLARTIREREEAQRLSDGNEELQKSKNILQSQMGLLGSKYLNNQNS